MTLASNFEVLKADFKKETGLNANENITLYIQYYGATMSDKNMQLSAMILQELKNLRR